MYKEGFLNDKVGVIVIKRLCTLTVGGFLLVAYLAFASYYLMRSEYSRSPFPKKRVQSPPNLLPYEGSAFYDFFSLTKFSFLVIAS